MESVKIKATLMWAFLNRKNEKSDRYQVDLTHLSDKAAQALESMGLTVNSKSEKGNYVTCKSIHPLLAFDDGGALLEGDNIGNGSEAVCVVSTYPWDFGNKKGLSPSLKKLVITKLVEYKPAVADDSEDDDIL